MKVILSKRNIPSIYPLKKSHHFHFLPHNPCQPPLPTQWAMKPIFWSIFHCFTPAREYEVRCWQVSGPERNIWENQYQYVMKMNYRFRLNSALFQLKLTTGAELGNIKSRGYKLPGVHRGTPFHFIREPEPIPLLDTVDCNSPATEGESGRGILVWRSQQNPDSPRQTDRATIQVTGDEWPSCARAYIQERGPPMVRAAMCPYVSKYYENMSVKFPLFLRKSGQSSPSL